MLRLAVMGIAIAVALSACKTDDLGASEATPRMTTPFDPAAAAYVQALGTATVKGVAAHMIEEQLVYGKNVRIRLMPITAYSTEYIDHLFRGGQSYTSIIEVQNVDPNFHTYMRYAKSEEDGKFIFYGVPSGDYYLYTVVTNKFNRGAGIYERISVADGQTVEVALDGA